MVNGANLQGTSVYIPWLIRGKRLVSNLFLQWKRVFLLVNILENMQIIRLAEFHSVFSKPAGSSIRLETLCLYNKVNYSVAAYMISHIQLGERVPLNYCT
jgi:hypothetical protein